jgi:hypothetical protein
MVPSVRVSVPCVERDGLATLVRRWGAQEHNVEEDSRNPLSENGMKSVDVAHDRGDLCQACRRFCVLTLIVMDLNFVVQSEQDQIEADISFGMEGW